MHLAVLPFGARFMTNMIQSKVVHDHTIPVISAELVGDMSCNVIIDFSKVLFDIDSAFGPALRFMYNDWVPTDTKKLEVPSARSNIPGNSFNHVSSPYIINFPPCLRFSWDNQVS